MSRIDPHGKESEPTHKITVGEDGGPGGEL